MWRTHPCIHWTWCLYTLSCWSSRYECLCIGMCHSNVNLRMHAITHQVFVHLACFCVKLSRFLTNDFHTHTHTHLTPPLHSPAAHRQCHSPSFLRLGTTASHAKYWRHVDPDCRYRNILAVSSSRANQLCPCCWICRGTHTMQSAHLTSHTHHQFVPNTVVGLPCKAAHEYSDLLFMKGCICVAPLVLHEVLILFVDGSLICRVIMCVWLYFYFDST